MRRPGLLVALMAIACATFGSAHVSASAADAATRARVPLRTTNWVLTDRVSIGTPLDDVAVNAVFGAERVEGSSGCNGYSNSYTTHGARMTIRNDGVSTQIACPGAAGKVEPAYLRRLHRVGRWRITGKTLTLSTRAGHRLLVYRAVTGFDALRGSWDVNSFFTGTAVSSPVPGSTLTLVFHRSDVSGDSGCNTFSGRYELRGVDGISLGPLASTLRACVDPAIGAQEQQYLAALALVQRYQVTGDTMTLFRDGDTIAASLHRAR
jgi:heat shock protein HslJ